MQNLILAACLLVYVLTCRLTMRCLGGRTRELTLAGINLAGVCYLLCGLHYDWFAWYLLIVLVQYAAFRLFANSAGGGRWLAFFTPIVMLIFIRYVLGPLFVGRDPHWDSADSKFPAFIGISYLAFRCSRLVLEVSNGSVKMPDFLEYLNFSFFLPTMPVGPINTYANFRRGFDAEPWQVPVGRAAFRVLVGLVKFKFIGGMFSQLTYSGILLNGMFHPLIHLPVAMVSYYLYLYCNFSGFCDMAIGAAALIGIPVPENFDDPLLARNMREFWNRWHITLSQWMRDIVFAPLSKSLVRLFGPARTNHAIALTIAVVFLLVGGWHGVGWNYAAFGLAQSLGVVTVHYYTIFLKRRLGRDGFKTYHENRWIHAAAVVVTFCYYSATLFLFANTGAQMKQIISVLR